MDECFLSLIYPEFHQGVRFLVEQFLSCVKDVSANNGYFPKYICVSATMTEHDKKEFLNMISPVQQVVTKPQPQPQPQPKQQITPSKEHVLRMLLDDIVLMDNHAGLVPPTSITHYAKTVENPHGGISRRKEVVMYIAGVDCCISDPNLEYFAFVISKTVIKYIGDDQNNRRCLVFLKTKDLCGNSKLKDLLKRSIADGGLGSDCFVDHVHSEVLPGNKNTVIDKLNKPTEDGSYTLVLCTSTLACGFTTNWLPLVVDLSGELSIHSVTQKAGRLSRKEKKEGKFGLYILYIQKKLMMNIKV